MISLNLVFIYKSYFTPLHLKIIIFFNLLTYRMELALTSTVLMLINVEIVVKSL